MFLFQNRIQKKVEFENLFIDLDESNFRNVNIFLL
jgi:hypothetical protein